MNSNIISIVTKCDYVKTINTGEAFSTAAGFAISGDDNPGIFHRVGLFASIPKIELTGLKDKDINFIPGGYYSLNFEFIGKLAK